MVGREIPLHPRGEHQPADADTILRALLAEMEAARADLREIKVRNGSGNGNGKGRYAWILGIAGALITAALIAAYSFIWQIDNRAGANAAGLVLMEREHNLDISALTERCLDHETRLRELERAHRIGGGI